MSETNKKVDFVFVLFDEESDQSFLDLLSRILSQKNIGNIHVYSVNPGIHINDGIKVNKYPLKRKNTGDSLLSILRNRNISDDFILCTKVHNFSDEVLDYIFNNPNSFPLIYKEFPNPNIKLDEFNRVETVEFKESEGFGYESLDMFRMSRSNTLILVQSYHVGFYNKELDKYVTSESEGFDILDLFNHTNWGLFAFDIFNIKDS